MLGWVFRRKFNSAPNLCNAIYMTMYNKWFCGWQLHLSVSNILSNWLQVSDHWTAGQPLITGDAGLGRCEAHHRWIHYQRTKCSEWRWKDVAQTFTSLTHASVFTGVPLNPPDSPFHRGTSILIFFHFISPQNTRSCLELLEFLL